MATINFVVSGNRIATESFAIGKIYEIIFTNGNFLICACNHIGNNFVVFQRELPELLFTLNMETASSVRSIEETGGGGGTYNYNSLENKPQINSVELSENKSSSDLGLQSALDTSQLDAVNSGITAAKVATFEGKQDAITSDNKLSADLVDDATTTNKFVTAADKAAWNAKQNALTASQLDAVNSGIDSTKVEQIETNKTNILSKAITGTCNTAAATAAKEVSIDGFVLVKGAIIGVKFGNTNSAANVTLNVNSTGAKSIYHNNAVYTGVSYQICGKKDTYTYYMYDGTYWCWLAIGENTAPAHLITTDTSTSITITGLDNTYNTNCLLLCTDRRTSNAVDSVYFVSRYNTAVRVAVLSGNTTPSATISGDVITISGLHTYQTITVLAAETVGIAAV